MQENIIGKYLISNNKIQCKYKNAYFKRVSMKYPLDIATAEIKVNTLLFEIHCYIHNNNIQGYIKVKKINKINNKLTNLDNIKLNSEKSNINTDIILDIINNWRSEYKNEIISDIQNMFNCKIQLI